MAYRKLGTLTSEHRKALIVNQTINTIMHESIKTTETRASYNFV